MTKNTIYTYEEYRKQGFKEHELWLIKKTDCMHNNWDFLTEKEKERYFIMAEYLKIWKMGAENPHLFFWQS